MSEKTFYGIKKIHVEKLFDAFTYDIDLIEDKNVSFLLAPNGAGKTTIFNMITFMFHPTLFRNNELCDIPFEYISCELTDGKTVALYRESSRRLPGGKSYYMFPLRYDLEYADNSEYQLKIVYDGISKYYMDFLDSALEYIASDIDFHIRTKDKYGDDNGEVLTNKDDFLFELNFKIVNIARQVRTKAGLGDVLYISADRVYNDMPIDARYEDDDMGADHSYDDPMTIIRNKLRISWNNINRAYTRKVSAARDSLLKNFMISEDDSPKLGKKELTAQIELYKEKIDALISDGIIENVTKDATINEIIDSNATVDAKNKRFLSAYLNAFIPTVTSKIEGYDKLKLLVDIYNDRNKITGKKLIVNHDGVCVKAYGKEIDLDGLSSGEQNDIIMFYNLIYNTREKDVVLIDEPEISLHMEWQESFLEYLNKVCAINNIQVISATHSPYIVNGRYDQVAEMQVERLYEE